MRAQCGDCFGQWKAVSSYFGKYSYWHISVCCVTTCKFRLSDNENILPYSRESLPMHGRCILLSHQTGGWALFRVFPHSTLKERPPLFTYTSSAIAAIKQQAHVSQSPPSTSTLLESLATSPLTTSSSLPPSAG